MFAIISVFFVSVSAHSWVHCTDYRGPKDYYDSSKCFGNVRPLERGPGDIIVPSQVAFGQDQGFNRNNADGDPKFRPVDGKCQSTITNQLAGGDYPAATYQRGQRVTLAWPTKNHVAASCTNRFIPDGFVKVFVEPYKNAQGNRFNQEIDGTWRQDPHVNGQIDFKGFQNCPKFCENQDKALCTGDFTVPDLPDGKYSFQWLWKFNPQDEYVTCWEADIRGAVPGNVAANVISTDGCHNNMDEQTCIAAVDNRGDYRGVKCAWCCGEFCNKDATGGNGGENRCEPVTFLEQEAGVTAFRNNEVDRCPKPTMAPTKKPTNTPSSPPTMRPTSEPTSPPTPAPSEQMMAPDPVSVQGPSGQAGQCAANLILCKNTMPGMEMEMPCCAGLECVAIGGGISQCRSNSATVNGEESDMVVSKNGVVMVAGLLGVAALCCCGAMIMMWRMSSRSRDGDAYHKQDSYESTDRERYSGRHERRRKTKRSQPTSGFTSDRKRESTHKKSSYDKTPGNANAPRTTGSDDEYLSDEPTPGDLPRSSTRV